MTRVPLPEHGGRYEYVLTGKGRDFFPTYLALKKWGDDWLAEPAGPQVVFKDRKVIEVSGGSDEAAILREMLVGGTLIEGGGCGFNPKAPRNTIYPAGSNAPGALHFGIDLAKPSDYIRKVMPLWEEPPVHQDLVTFDTTVTAGANTIIDRGFLLALRDADVVEMAQRYGDPVDLLEGQV